MTGDVVARAKDVLAYGLPISTDLAWALVHEVQRLREAIACIRGTHRPFTRDYPGGDGRTVCAHCHGPVGWPCVTIRLRPRGALIVSFDAVNHPRHYTSHPTDPALVERVWRVLLDRTRQQADQDDARAVLDAITETHAVVELPKSPSEYWGRDHQPQWNHYPFTRVDGDEVEIGARSEHVFRVNAAEALTFAADLLAAARYVESGPTTPENKETSS